MTFVTVKEIHQTILVFKACLISQFCRRVIFLLFLFKPSCMLLPFLFVCDFISLCDFISGCDFISLCDFSFHMYLHIIRIHFLSLALWRTTFNV